MAWFTRLSLYLLLTIISSLCVSVQTEDVCSFDHGLYFNSHGYSYFYLKLENALINRHNEMLENLRAGFMRTNTMFVDFTVTLNVKVINDTSNICNFDFGDQRAFYCHYDYDCDTFVCPLGPLHLSYSTATSENFIAWISYFHGSLLSFFVMINWQYHVPYNEFDITFNIDQIDCNPSLQMMMCVLSELFSWIKVYSEDGGIPQSWDQHQKGRITFKDNANEIIKFMNWPISTDAFVILCVTEYVFVSLSLSLVIARFFPAIHSQFVTKATTLEYRSLYWGLAVVSNLLVYGLFFATASGLAIVAQDWKNPLNIPNTLFIIVTGIQEGVSHLILFVAAVVASVRSSHSTHIPIPTGMAKVVLSISFCFTCFCCFVCCSRRCRAKTLNVLVMFSLMTSIYHSVMEAISFGFILFDDVSRTTTITVTMLYISLMLFAVAFVSFSLFLLSRGRNISFFKQSLYCFGVIFLLLTVFCAILLLVVMYMIVFFSLNLTGVKGILTGLIPSIALSTVTWYIRKRLQKDQAQLNKNTPTVYGATHRSVNTVNDQLKKNETTEQTKLLV